MAQDTPETLQITLPPNEILINGIQVSNGHVNNLTLNNNIYTTCNEALSCSQLSLENHNRPLRPYYVRTRRESKKLKELAQSANVPDKVPGPLQIRNAIPAEQLPKPKRATP